LPDAKTGVRMAAFGNKGAIDLKQDDDQEILPDLTTGEIGIQSAPVVAKTQSYCAAFREGMTPKSMRNNKGYVRDLMYVPASACGSFTRFEERRAWV